MNYRPRPAASARIAGPCLSAMNWRKMRPGFFLPLAIFFVFLVILAIAPLWFYIIQYKINKPEPAQPSPILSTSPTPSPASLSITDETVYTDSGSANWKVLNNKNGFSLKYPNSLKALGEGMEVDETNASDVIIATNPGDPQDSSPSLHINISPKAGTVYKDMTLAQISKENYDANQANKNTFKQVVTPLKLITLDGKPAYTYTLLTSGFSGKW